MVEEQRKRMEDQIEKMIQEIDKSHLRKMQGDMHKCAAVCCDNGSFSAQKVQSCIDNCSTPWVKANHYVQEEFRRIENRLQRCIMDCNDTIKDKAGPNPTQTEINQLTQEFENCATKCIDNYCDSLPSWLQSVKKVLSSGKFDVQ